MGVDFIELSTWGGGRANGKNSLKRPLCFGKNPKKGTRNTDKGRKRGNKEMKRSQFKGGRRVHPYKRR